jgi:uncharacterized protein
MKINISNLSEGVHEYELLQNAEELGLSKNFTGDVIAHAALEKTTRQILLRAKVRAQAVFQCDRCANEFHIEIRSAFETAYMWENGGNGEESDDFHILSPDINIIDISKDVKEFTLLAVPLKLLCKENCAGLCPRCGRNLNGMPNGMCTCPPKEIESRWSALEKLKKVAH